jgi:peptide/nickel transport system ATP-binding protein
VNDPTGALLQVRGLTTEFTTDRGVIAAVNGVDLEVLADETVAVVGESGCGKSVTALSILGLVDAPGRVVAGAIRYRGEDLLAKTPEQMQRIRGNEIAMIFQEPMSSLNPVHTIGAQIIEALRIHRGMRKRKALAHTLEMLRLVGIPSPEQRVFDYPHQFSGGMRQRVMIAMALSCDPALLIADEPTTALDVTIQAQILELIRDLSPRFGTAVVIITHDLGVVAEMAQRVVVMYAGQVVEQATTAELFAQPGHPYTRALLQSIPSLEAPRGARLTPITGAVPDPLRLPPGCAFAPRCELAVDRCRDAPPPLLPAGAGRLARCLLYDPSAADAGAPAAFPGAALHATPANDDPSVGTREAPDGLAEQAAPDFAPAADGGNDVLLEARGLTMHFPVTAGVFRHVVGHVRAVDGVSFDIARGETLGLVGESGCGKSTTGRLLLRLLRATGGSVRFEGAPVFALQGEALRALRRDMQIVFQDPFGSLNPRMTVRDMLAEPFVIHGQRRQARNRVPELLRRVGLAPEHAARYPHQFSGGQRQRIGIARALALAPKLLVCDEPVSALDVSIQAQILNLLHDLQRDMGLTYLFIAHDLSVVRHICDRVAVMYLGQIVEQADAGRLFAEPAHPYTQALLSAVPHIDPSRRRERVALAGDVPNAAAPPSGCRFHTRCPYAQPHCRDHAPALAPVPDAPGHAAACHLLTGAIERAPRSL